MNLAALTLHAAPRPGVHATAVGSLTAIRADRTYARVHSLHKPALCFIVQGTKVVTVGGDSLRYGAEQYLFSSVELPVTGEVVEATPKNPYLCLAVQIEPSLVFELASMVEPASAAASKKGIFVGKRDPRMTDAFARLVQCLADPTDARVLAPTLVREITYRLLTGPYRAAVRDLGVVGGQTQRIARVIERLKRNYAEPLRAHDLAKLAGMSVSTFHEHFKRVTRLSPLQFQKQLRLHEARRLLLDDAAGAAEVGFRVGYQSPSQFSREYARFFWPAAQERSDPATEPRCRRIAPLDH